MAATASAAVKKIRSWHGDSESNGRAQHDIMNPYNKLMGCHKSVKTTAWCAITIVVMLWLIGVKTFCKSAGCTQQMRWYKRKKRWKDRGVTPQIGWIPMYHFKKWDKKKKKYVRKSVPGHTGCVIAVNTKKHLMQVEEGNNKNAVRTRTIDYRSLDIMGFCIPYYK